MSIEIVELTQSDIEFVAGSSLFWGDATVRQTEESFRQCVEVERKARVEAAQSATN